MSDDPSAPLVPLQPASPLEQQVLLSALEIYASQALAWAGEAGEQPGEEAAVKAQRYEEEAGAARRMIERLRARGGTAERAAAPPKRRRRGEVEQTPAQRAERAAFWAEIGLPSPAEVAGRAAKAPARDE